MIFREATREDIPSMRALRLAVRENVLSDPNRITFEMYESYLGARGKTWVCVADGEIAGFSSAASFDNSIWALFVSEKYEARGIGKRLLQIAVEWLFGAGASVISLSTAENTRADRFYESLGWTRGEIDHRGEVHYTLKNQGFARGSEPDGLESD